MQFHGRNAGKKVKAIRIVRHAFEIIHLLTGKNPLEVFVNAILQAGPREDSTRIGAGGVVRKQAVDVSPLRRVNQAIYLISNGSRDRAVKTHKTIAECLADEIINTEKGNIQSSFALKKKEEIEKVAKTNRWSCESDFKIYLLDLLLYYTFIRIKALMGSKSSSGILVDSSLSQTLHPVEKNYYQHIYLEHKKTSGKFR